MKLYFKDSALTLTYIQIKLKEQYNPDIIINNEYYISFNNHYGLAHYIAKYLNMMYPPLDSSYSVDLPDSAFATPKKLTDPISIMNYFLCDNMGNKLENNLVGSDIDISKNSTMQKLYGNDICAIFDINDPPLLTSYDNLIDGPQSGQYYIVSPYLDPLLQKIEAFNYQDRINNLAKEERIYNMEMWETSKSICEIDDLVMSYLLGRTITPSSSREDIYYVQQLFTQSSIPVESRGIWNSSFANLTDLIMEYQKSKVSMYSSDPIFVTGYFDIFTEASILKDRGEQTYGIYGL